MCLHSGKFNKNLATTNKSRVNIRGQSCESFVYAYVGHKNLGDDEAPPLGIGVCG